MECLRLPRSMRDDAWLFFLAGKLAVAGLTLAVPVTLRAGEGRDFSATNNAAAGMLRPGDSSPPASHLGESGGLAAATSASTNALRLWIDVSTNESRSDLLAHADMTATNSWQPKGMYSSMSSSSVWRTTATLVTGFFHANRAGWPGYPGYVRRSEDGWFQEIGVDVERNIDHGDSAIFLGIGVNVGRATFRSP